MYGQTLLPWSSTYFHALVLIDPIIDPYPGSHTNVGAKPKCHTNRL